ncbi:EXLDI protein [Nocardia jejuensis]|uniref:EXLDI protein n=1 Tax=Nocardia jejuensis TaxID=328049 RepID=UPI00082DDEB6|nr:EXLDI protein [Nocardia jejuensis]
MATDMHKNESGDTGEAVPPQGVTATNLPAVLDIRDADSMREIVLRVGPGGGRTQRFTGRLLAESQQVNKVGSEAVRVYLSRKGKLVVHRHYLEWSDFSTATKHAYHEKKQEFVTARKASDQSDFSAITNWAKGFKNWRELLGIGDDGYGDYTLEIVESPGELTDRVPAKVYRIVADVMENPSAQVLDI